MAYYDDRPTTPRGIAATAQKEPPQNTMKITPSPPSRLEDHADLSERSIRTAALTIPLRKSSVISRLVKTTSMSAATILAARADQSMRQCAAPRRLAGSRRSRYSPQSYSPSPERRKSRRKSFGEQALGASGLGGGAAAAAYKHDRDQHRDRDYRGSDRDYYDRDRRDRRGRSYSRSHRRDSSSRSRSRSRHRSKTKEERIAQAARAALAAGAVQAFRSRKDPGPWTGEKGKAILTAAVAAAGTDGLVDKDPKKHSKRHTIESTLAGLAAGQLMNRGRSKSRGRGHKSSGGLKDLVSAGALAAAGKEIYDRFSRSRSRPRGRDGSRDSSGSESDERSSRRDGHRGSQKRSKSVSDYLSKGMAALGLEAVNTGAGARGEEEATEIREISDEREKPCTRVSKKRKKRIKELEEGKITPEEARKRRIKADVLDVASIGLAALGIKGAVGEWKEVLEKRKERREFQEECARHAELRKKRRARSQGPPYRRRWPDEIEDAPSPVHSWKPNTPVQALEAPQATY
ncbi:hypothetical protein N7470_007725 [Penicillium chermesinum]|nr:hypothetical protein N7470_007725 [Penicillium chermesinum]